MIPLKDDNRSLTRPYVTYAILGLNVLIYLIRNEFTSGSRSYAEFIGRFGAVPYLIFNPAGVTSYLRILSSMFVHAGLMHVAGNMLFLWVFADNVEDRIGHVKFVFFYLICGIAGTLLHVVFSRASTIPMVGASGAISGVLGAYILLFPKARVLALVPLGFFMRLIPMPSYIFLGLWFIYQFFLGFLALGAGGGGVAYLAHIGGFITGLAIALPFRAAGRGSRTTIDYKIL